LADELIGVRLDNTLHTEMRRLSRVGLLILDDFALRPLDATETNDFYELVVERHRKASTIVTSNREPAEWLTMISDALLAQSAVDRLTAGAHTLGSVSKHCGPRFWSQYRRAGWGGFVFAGVASFAELRACVYL
jgi:DNA replication protein DnaC